MGIPTAVVLRLVPFLAAGFVTGLLGVVLFGVVHAATILPIWNRLAGGIASDC